mgnify:CR=1 FL=1|jgi:hypothetical protein
MLNVYFAIAANRVIVDSITNQVSIIDLFEQLKAPSFPVLVPKLTLLYYLSRDKGDPVAKDLTVVCKLSDVEIFKVDVQVDFKDEESTRIVLGVDGLTLSQPGIFQAFLMDKETSLGVLDLTVEEAKASNSVATLSTSR